jgi:hypothetical protein
MHHAHEQRYDRQLAHSKQLLPIRDIGNVSEAASWRG